MKEDFLSTKVSWKRVAVATSFCLALIVAGVWGEKALKEYKLNQQQLEVNTCYVHKKVYLIFGVVAVEDGNYIVQGIMNMFFPVEGKVPFKKINVDKANLVQIDCKTGEVLDEDLTN